MFRSKPPDPIPKWGPAYQLMERQIFKGSFPLCLCQGSLCLYQGSSHDLTCAINRIFWRFGQLHQSCCMHACLYSDKNPFLYNLFMKCLDRVITSGRHKSAASHMPFWLVFQNSLNDTILTFSFMSLGFSLITIEFWSP